MSKVIKTGYWDGGKAPRVGGLLFMVRYTKGKAGDPLGQPAGYGAFPEARSRKSYGFDNWEVEEPLGWAKFTNVAPAYGSDHQLLGFDVSVLLP